ncbi:NAD(P)H-hydrate dehydratase [Arthrobacter sp. UM1]|uniref:NAD(P)H-hydrate dehydratase n=1 Tax=Arthrobacter sp. UM1 TaxID=2766776 RepID=UPI001CF70547|nr:NAD(P)H-hydrate dehydratase [Arthrobacter sp. UM1]MCB4209085.1 NAD(P)H-hydrate dehydratase [Arthrobacter sp. UM1]
MFTAADAAAVLPRVPRDAHKYSRGVTGVSTGTSRFPGAAVLGVSAALCTGTGMVRYRGPSDVAGLVLSRRPEPVCERRTQAPGRVQAWVVGSGMPEDAATRAELRFLESRAPEAVFVVDAGALAFVEPAEPENRPRTLLTPHAGELQRMLGRWGESAERAEIEASPEAWARRAADLSGHTVLLKGPATAIASPGADPLLVEAGHPWLATAGTGDVLAGVIGALAAGSRAPLDRVAAAGAWIHGQAGALAAEDGPFGASELPAAVRTVVARLLAEHSPEDAIAGTEEKQA